MKRLGYPSWKYLHNTVFPKPSELGSSNFERIFTPHHVSHVTCHVAHVMCKKNSLTK